MEMRRVFASQWFHACCTSVITHSSVITVHDKLSSHPNFRPVWLFPESYHLLISSPYIRLSLVKTSNALWHILHQSKCACTRVSVSVWRCRELFRGGKVYDFSFISACIFLLYFKGEDKPIAVWSNARRKSHKKQVIKNINLYQINTG